MRKSISKSGNERIKLSPQQNWREQTNQAKILSAENYFSFLKNEIKEGTPYATWKRVQETFAPALWLGRAVRIFYYIFRAVEASALFLLAVALVFALLPPVLILSLAFSYAAAGERRRANRRYASLFRGRRVLAFTRTQSTPYFDRMLASLTGEYTVLLVGDAASPHFDRKTMPLVRAAHLRQDGVLLVRTPHYFYLRRTLLREADFFAAIF